MAGKATEERRAKVDELRLLGMTGYTIAKRMKISTSTIYNDIKYLEEEEERIANAVVREQKRLEIDKQLQKQIATAARLMDKTLRSGKTRKVTVRQGDKEDYTETTEENYLPHYNATIGFQRNLLDALARRAALWGVEQNKQQVDVTGLDELLGCLSEAANSGSK